MFLRILPCLLFVLSSYYLIGWETRFTADYVTTKTFTNASGCGAAEVRDSDPSTCKTDPLALAVGADYGAHGRSFAMHWGALSLAAANAASLAALVTAFSSTAQVANFVTVLIMLVLVMFSGALVSHKGMPGYIAWLSDISPFAYVFEALAIGQFQGQCLLFNPTTMPALFNPTHSGTAMACVEIAGYQWLLQFGCTAVGRFNSITDFPSNPFSDPQKCAYTYTTMELDGVMGLLLLAGYTLLALCAFAFLVHERR